MMLEKRYLRCWNWQYMWKLWMLAIWLYIDCEPTVRRMTLEMYSHVMCNHCHCHSMFPRYIRNHRNAARSNSLGGSMFHKRSQVFAPEKSVGVWERFPMLIVEQASLIFKAVKTSTLDVCQMFPWKAASMVVQCTLLWAFFSVSIWVGVSLWTRCAYSAPA